jgi:prepilin-type N-terminal cleavage/methylation domain-containing protein
MLLLEKQLIKRGESGFTLVELLVVIAIISLMAGLGSGAFVGTLERLKLDKAANSLLMAGRYARLIAVEQQKRYRLCLDQNNNGFYLLTTIYDEEGALSEDTVVNDSYSKPFSFDGDIRFEQIEIVSSSDIDTAYEDLPTVVFKPDGTAESAIIQIGNGKLSYTVSINASTGKTKLIAGTAENVTTISTVDLDAED